MNGDDALIPYPELKKGFSPVGAKSIKEGEDLIIF
jgi:hypothetical protein